MCVPISLHQLPLLIIDKVVAPVNAAAANVDANNDNIADNSVNGNKVHVLRGLPVIGDLLKSTVASVQDIVVKLDALIQGEYTVDAADILLRDLEHVIEATVGTIEKEVDNLLGPYTAEEVADLVSEVLEAVADILKELTQDKHYDDKSVLSVVG